VKQLAEKIVDALLEGWLRDRWEDVKELTGIGYDEYGLGKNVEKGWKPKFRGQVSPLRQNTRVRRRPPGAPGDKTWEIG
jgi:hypothetical protein